MAGGNGHSQVHVTRLVNAYEQVLTNRTIGLSTRARARGRKVASATTLSDGRDVTDAASQPVALTQTARLQDQAWAAYDGIGEVTTLVEGTAGLLSQCRFYIGAKLRVGDQLIDTPMHMLPDMDEGVVTEVENVWSRFTDESGSQSGLVRAIAQNWSVISCCKMVGYVIDGDGKPVEPPADLNDLPDGYVELWQAVAPTSLTLESQTANIWKLAVTRDSWVKLIRPVVYDLRWSHPRYPGEALGWVMAALDICKDLRTFTMAQRSAARSGIPADLLLAPIESNPKRPAQLGLDDPDADTTDLQAWGDEWALEIEEMLGEFIMDAANDADAGTGVVPGVLTVGQDFIEKFTKISFAREVDRGLGELVNQARARLAEAADCPPEMLRGLGSTNRWNGGQIADDEYRRYFRPKANAIADALTAGPFRNGMAAEGLDTLMDLLGLRVLVDPSEAVASPDYSKLALGLFDREVIGLRGVRRLLGVSDDLAPTPAELEQMRELKALSQPEPADNPGRGDQGPPSDAEPVDNDRGAVVVTGHLPAPPLALATGRRPLGDRLLTVEVETRGQLGAACEAALDRAIDRAVAKLRSWARKAGIEVPDSSGAEFVTALGVGRVRQLADDNGPGPQDMWLAALSGLKLQFRRIAHDAYSRAEAAVGATLPAVEVEAAIARAEDVLIAGMMQLADEQVFSAPGVPLGEMGSLRVPVTLLRRVMAAAGGAYGVGAGLDPDDQAAFGLVFGPLLARIAPDYDGLAWVYGEAARTKHFEPHQVLDGTRLAGPTDPVLSGAPFATGFYFPGDHRGCLCLWKPNYIEAGE